MRKEMLAIGFVVASALNGIAAVPGGIEITCDVPRTKFRTAASGQTVVNFRLWSMASGGSQLGSDYTVTTGSLAVAKRYTDKYDSVSSRKTARINAVIGSDGSPVLLPSDGQAYLEVQVGTSVFGCDLAASGSESTRRRLLSVAFARESSHSQTCETCTTAIGAEAIRFPNYLMTFGEVIQSPSGDGFFMINAGGGSHFALGYYTAGVGATIIAQSGGFSTVQDTPGKINLYSGGATMAVQKLIEPGTTQVSVGTFSY